MKEVWRSVVGYEGYYEVSSWGRVRSLPRKTHQAGMRGGRILKTYANKQGYLRVQLSKDGVQKDYSVHRLVAEAFVPNPENKPQVNHNDENKTNNFVFVREDGSVDSQKSNLKWMTAKENSNYGTRNKRAGQSISKSQFNGKKSKIVYQYTLNGEFIKVFPSTREVQRQTGYDQGSIAACCRGEQKTAYGFIWSYTKL